MAGPRTNTIAALLQQSRTVHTWLGGLTAADFERRSVLADWDVRTLTGHLVVIHVGFSTLLQRPTRSKPLPVHEFVRNYRRDVDQITASTRETTGERSGGDLVAQLEASILALEAALTSTVPLPATLDTPRGPGGTADFIKTRIIELIIHSDDLSRSLPEREPIVLHRMALSTASRTLAAILAAQHPGRSLEVRIPPFAAVQCGTDEPGPTHTRGTPPNVVETDTWTFLQLATGRLSWADAVQAGSVSASGLRADLTGLVPVLS